MHPFHPLVFYKEPFKAKHPLRVRGWEKKITSKWKNHHTYSNTAQNILETKTNQKGGKGECFSMKGKISQERITILNKCIS